MSFDRGKRAYCPNFLKGLDGFEISCYDLENIFLLFFLLFLHDTISLGQSCDRYKNIYDIFFFLGENKMENYMILL